MRRSFIARASRAQFPVARAAKCFSSLFRINETCRVNHASVKLASESWPLCACHFAFATVFAAEEEGTCLSLTLSLFPSISRIGCARYARVDRAHRLLTRSPSRKCSIVSFDRYRVSRLYDAWIWSRNSPPHRGHTQGTAVVPKSRVFPWVFFFLSFLLFISFVRVTLVESGGHVGKRNFWEKESEEKKVFLSPLPLFFCLSFSPFGFRPKSFLFFSGILCFSTLVILTGCVRRSFPPGPITRQLKVNYRYVRHNAASSQ